MNTPNRITLSRFVITIIFVIIYSLDNFLFPVKNYFLAGTFFLGVVTDALDGYLARRFNQITTFGIYIDPIADKVLMLSAMICLVHLHRLSPVIAITLLSRDFIVTGIRLLASKKGIVIPALISGKIKVFLETILMLYLLLDFNVFILKIVLIMLSELFAYLSLIKIIINNKNLFII